MSLSEIIGLNKIGMLIRIYSQSEPNVTRFSKPPQSHQNWWKMLNLRWIYDYL